MSLSKQYKFSEIFIILRLSQTANHTPNLFWIWQVFIMNSYHKPKYLQNLSIKENRGRRRTSFLFIPVFSEHLLASGFSDCSPGTAPNKRDVNASQLKPRTAVRSRPPEWWPLSLKRTYGRDFIGESERAHEGCSIKLKPVILKSVCRIFWYWYPPLDPQTFIQ